MEELGSLERHDRQRRQEAVARIPVILHKRVVILFFLDVLQKTSLFAQQMQKYCDFEHQAVKLCTLQIFF